MMQAFVFEQVAVLVSTWQEPMDPPERGARIEVRVRVSEPRRGSPSAAQRVVLDGPLFRADLFDQVDHPVGNLRSAHFHPHFDGVEPSERHWSEDLRADPISWLVDQLVDLPQLLGDARADLPDRSAIGRDALAVRAAMPAIVAAVEAAWDEVRAVPATARP
jgi:hypothetical protein